MIDHTYVYEGVSYKRTAKNIAFRQLEYDPNRRFFLVGSNVNEYNFHSGWGLATLPTSKTEIEQNYSEKITTLYNEFAFHLERELGRAPVFYVERGTKGVTHVI